jgi:hypothetical protein
MDPTEYVSPPLHLGTETDPVYKMLCSLVVFRIEDNGKSLKTE